MTLSKSFYLMDRMDQLVRMQATGPPRNFARRLGISVATLYRHINTLKARGVPITYNADRQTFYYTESGSFSIKFLIEE